MRQRSAIIMGLLAILSVFPGPFAGATPVASDSEKAADVRVPQADLLSDAMRADGIQGKKADVLAEALSSVVKGKAPTGALEKKVRGLIRNHQLRSVRARYCLNGMPPPFGVQTWCIYFGEGRHVVTFVQCGIVSDDGCAYFGLCWESPQLYICSDTPT